MYLTSKKQKMEIEVIGSSQLLKKLGLTPRYRGMVQSLRKGLNMLDEDKVKEEFYEQLTVNFDLEKWVEPSIKEKLVQTKTVNKAKVALRSLRSNIFKHMDGEEKKKIKEIYMPQRVLKKTTARGIINKPFGDKEFSDLVARAGKNQ